MLAPSVGHYRFVRDDGEPLPFLPGQFVQVHFQYADGTATKRSYSLATRHDPAQAADATVEIAVSFVAGGAATALFEALEIGGQVVASGPFGRFCLQPEETNRRYLLIATGTGVTPYRSMLPLLEKAMAERGVEVVLKVAGHHVQRHAAQCLHAVVVGLAQVAYPQCGRGGMRGQRGCGSQSRPSRRVDGAGEVQRLL